MTINCLSEIAQIEILAKPSWKDSFKDNQTQKFALPYVFFAGSLWQLEHDCIQCRSRIKVSLYDGTMKLFGALSQHDFQSKQFIKTIGEAFQLNLRAYTNENGDEIYTIECRKYLVISPIFSITNAIPAMSSIWGLFVL